MNIKTLQEVLLGHCPDMHSQYLDDSGRAFRDRILQAMQDHTRRALIDFKDRCAKAALIGVLAEDGSVYNTKKVISLNNRPLYVVNKDSIFDIDIERYLK